MAADVDKRYTSVALLCIIAHYIQNRPRVVGGCLYRLLYLKACYGANPVILLTYLTVKFLMDSQDTKFNYNIILAALVAVVIGILIAFYYSHAQSASQIDFLEKEKKILISDLTLMKADVDRLSTLNEVNDIIIF